MASSLPNFGVLFCTKKSAFWRRMNLAGVLTPPGRNAGGNFLEMPSSAYRPRTIALVFIMIMSAWAYMFWALRAQVWLSIVAATRMRRHLRFDNFV
jgi:hypothetical protein